MTFEELGLSAPLLQAVQKEGYAHPTPIQEQAVPQALLGKDLLGSAQTGTGKTAAFALPILQRLTKEAATAGAASHKRSIRALVLTPTRELASQIQASFTAYGQFTKIQSAVIFGGVGQRPQEDMLRRGVDVLIATPGRLLDLMNQGFVDFRHIEVFVLDEADRMLDMGFIHDVRKIIAKLPKKRQTLFFSATMPADIKKLADEILQAPVRVAVAPVSQVADRITQCVYFIETADKRGLLVELLKDPGVDRVLIFTRTKHGANRLAEQLGRSHISAQAIHGNKSQSARERALTAFKAGTLRALVATDIAARGIDIDELTHVVNFDLPNVPETYVHRIGRTARAGGSGVAWAFCAKDERPLLRDIEKVIRQAIAVAEVPRFDNKMPPPLPGESARPTSRPGGAHPRRPNGQPNRGRPQAGRGAPGSRRTEARAGGRPSGQPSGRASEGRGGGRASENRPRRSPSRPSR